MRKRQLFLVLVLGLAAGMAGGSTLKINFQSTGAPTPEGYLPDYGDPFGDRGNGFSYGWNLEIRSDARDRNSSDAPDQRYDTLNHLQKGSTDKIWEIALPNGTYNVYLVCGDPDNTDQTNTMDVEGAVLVDPDGQAGTDFDFDEYHVTVELTDGRLTIGPAEGADNAKICFVELESDELTRFFSTARDPSPADGALGVALALFQWTAGDTAIFHNVYLGTSPDLTEADLVSSHSPMTLYYHVPGFEPGATYYWRVDEVAADGTVAQGTVWSFVSISLTAWRPGPADGAVDVLLDTVLTWEKGMAAVPLTHALYFGEDFDDVNEAAADADKGIVEAPGYDPGLLEPDTTYYWRVDQVGPDGTVRRGGVWSFDTVAAGPGKIVREWWFDISGSAVGNLTGSARYPDDPDGREFVLFMEGPVNWSEQYGSRLRGWLFVPETGDYTFWIAAEDEGQLFLSTDEDPANAVLIAGSDDADPQQWDASADQQSSPQSLVAGQRYYIEAIMKENSIGDNIAVAWQGPGLTRQVISADYVGATPYVSERAYNPAPAHRATSVTQMPTCQWRAGVNASQHDVYFGTDETAVAQADTTTADIYKGRQGSTSYVPGELQWGLTYYWRVDESNADGSITPGRVWSFTTADYLIVDDFEGYDDDMDAGTAIFQTWVDGVENATGSYVGYELAIGGTFGETTIVHDGHQSMPLEYDNAPAPYYSETSRTWNGPQDWTIHGVDTLTVYIVGDAANAAEPLYVALEDSRGNLGVEVHPDGAIATTGQWVEWNVPLSRFSSAGVDVTAVRVMYLGLGSRSTPTPGGAGLIFIDDVRVTQP